MSTLPTSLIAILTGFTTALFYAVPGAFGLDNGSSGVKVAPLASGGNKPRVPKRDNISQKARDLIPFKKLIARGPDNSDPTKQSQNGGDKSQRINIDSSSYSDKTTPDFDIQPPGEGKVNLRAPISLDKPEENNENAENKDQSSTKSNQPSTLKPMGVIRFDDDRRADRKHLKGGLSIFSCLDEALVKSPRAAAMRAYLPVTKALFARATEQPSPQFFYDEGVRAEQNRRLGAVF